MNADEITGHDPDCARDHGIIRSARLTPAQIRVTAERHRTPLVLRCVEHCLAGKRFLLNRPNRCSA